MPYEQYFGGVVALSWEHLDLINGLSNRLVHRKLLGVLENILFSVFGVGVEKMMTFTSA